MEKQYNPALVEDKWYSRWTELKLFKADENSSKPKYSIVIPPPNVTGVLHMGHALNNTIQDILVRYHRMAGREALWMPGTDHAGIATQNVVERKLAKDKKTRHDLGREAFIDEVWKWKDEYHATITGQLKKLGSSCDWDRERFTMDEGLSLAVRRVFVRLYKEGLIYKGKYIINWCPRCRTALSDEEAEHKELNGKLYHFKYPFCRQAGS
jgi:valyl-tRNA synthetase